MRVPLPSGSGQQLKARPPSVGGSKNGPTPRRPIAPRRRGRWGTGRAGCSSWSQRGRRSELSYSIAGAPRPAGPATAAAPTTPRTDPLDGELLGQPEILL